MRYEILRRDHGARRGALRPRRAPRLREPPSRSGRDRRDPHGVGALVRRRDRGRPRAGSTSSRSATTRRSEDRRDVDDHRAAGDPRRGLRVLRCPQTRSATAARSTGTSCTRSSRWATRTTGPRRSAGLVVHPDYRRVAGAPRDAHLLRALPLHRDQPARCSRTASSRS